jgi:hypothetical protein
MFDFLAGQLWSCGKVHHAEVKEISGTTTTAAPFLFRLLSTFAKKINKKMSFCHKFRDGKNVNTFFLLKKTHTTEKLIVALRFFVKTKKNQHQ